VWQGKIFIEQQCGYDETLIDAGPCVAEAECLGLFGSKSRGVKLRE